MAALANQRRKQRIDKGICISCGKKPSFWGRRCIVCRQVGSTDPLPNGARRALHAYRLAEKKRSAEKLESELRTVVQHLLASDHLNAEEALALTLRMGLDCGKRRTYAEVGALMNVTGERVRQLLAASKWIIKKRLKTFGTHSPDVSPLHMAGGQFSWFICGTCHPGAYTKTGDGFSYHEWDLANLILKGVRSRRCDRCGCDGIIIEAPSILRIAVAKEILTKSGLLFGVEFRFLRITFNLSLGEFARRLGMTMGALQVWENSEQLTRRNDLAARMVIAAGCLDEQSCGGLLKSLLNSELGSSLPRARIVARRNEPTNDWIATTICTEAKV